LEYKYRGMKKLIKLILSLFSAPGSWNSIDRELVDVKWSIPQLDVINYSLVTKNFSVTYDEQDNTVIVLQVGSDEEVAVETVLTVSSRVFTKINNVIKKSTEVNTPVIPRALFKKWESDLIESQGKGENTYHSLRYPPAAED